MTKAREEENRLFKIRNRVSYRRWAEAYDMLRKLGLTHSKCRGAMKVADMMVNKNHGYGSGTGAYYAFESLEQVAIDMKRADRKGA